MSWFLLLLSCEHGNDQGATLQFLHSNFSAKEIRLLSDLKHAPYISRTTHVAMGDAEVQIDEPSKQFQSPQSRSRFQPLSVTESLPPCFHGVFPFRYFNSIQADCFPCLYHSRDSAVVASPTGSGKTSLFELAILGMLKESLSPDGITGTLVMEPGQKGQRKAIYVAPMKSLVQEKAQVRVDCCAVYVSSWIDLAMLTHTALAPANDAIFNYTGVENALWRHPRSHGQRVHWRALGPRCRRAGAERHHPHDSRAV